MGKRFTKEEIGRSFWTLLHSMASQVNDPPTQKDIESVTRFLQVNAESFPCPECRPGFEFVKRNPPDFSSRKALLAWTCEFHNTISRPLDKATVDCKLFAEEISTCPTCGDIGMHLGVLRDDAQIIREALEAESRGASMHERRIQEMAHGILDIESKKFNVPKPKRIIFEENTTFCPGTSCTIMDPKHPAETSQTWLNPNKFSLRVLLHEWYHHMVSILGRDRVKQIFGNEFSGDPDDEGEANRFAEREISFLREIGAQKLNNNDGKSMQMSQQVLRQEAIFQRLQDLYAPFEAISKVSRAELNKDYTSELFGRALEVGYDTVLTPLGSRITNFLTYLALAAIGANVPAIASYDREFLNDWAAHHLWSILRLAEPGELRRTTGAASSLGQAIGQGRSEDALHQIVRRPEEIVGGFRNALDAIQKSLAPLVRAPSTTETPSQSLEQDADEERLRRRPPAFQ